MNRLSFMFIAALLAAGLQTTRAQQNNAQGEKLLASAQHKATVDGDLKGAIEEYKKIVAGAGGNRALAATALVRMAECYQKLGDPDSRKTYERIVREFADQKESVVIARARLGRTESAERAGGISSRQVWTLPDSGTGISGTVSHDGRYVPYTDWGRGGGERFLHDLRSGADRQLTSGRKINQEYIEDGGAFSADDTAFAYSSHFNNGPAVLRIVGLQAPGIPRPRVLFSNPEVSRISADDWSGDGKWLAVQLRRNDKTGQIGLVAVQDGSLRVLKSLDWRGSSMLFFSPDSKYLAYDLPTDAGAQRDVFVLAIDGSREIPAVVHPGNDVLMGWSPDGRRLLFTSDRTGSTGLWAVAFVDGNPQGAPEQIKVDVAGASMGVTSKGVLYSFIHHPSFSGGWRSDIQVAGFDFAKGQFLTTPAVAVHAFVGANNFPTWSPDGKYLAFLSRRGERIQGQVSTVIGILSPDTGELRELRPALNIYAGGASLQWSPDGRSLAIFATDSKGRNGIFRIDAATGEATPIALGSEGENLLFPVWAPDGKTIYYSHYSFAGGVTAIVERDLASGNEKELIRKSGRQPFLVDLSPDGKYWVGVDGDWFAGPGNTPGRMRKWNVVLIPVSGGETKELMRGESHGADILMWAPDSRSIFVKSIKDQVTVQSAPDYEVWRVAIDGSESQKVDLKVNFLGPRGNSDPQLRPHPDGKRVAFAAAEPAKPEEVWALENFLLAQSAKK